MVGHLPRIAVQVDNPSSNLPEPWVITRSLEPAAAREHHGNGHYIDWTPRLLNRCRRPDRDPYYVRTSH